MKTLLFFFLFLLFQFNVKADTISNWGIYINDSLIFEDNLHQEYKDSILTLNLDNVKEDEILKIVFRECTVNTSKKQNLVFIDKKGKILLNVFKNNFEEGNWNYITINKSEMILLMNKGVISISYSEHQHETNKTFTFWGYWKLCHMEFKGKALPFDNHF